jgi:HemK-related putative methylase
MYPVRLFHVAQSGLSMATDSETMQTLLRPPQYGYLRLAIGKILHWHFRMFRSRGEAQPVLEQICGMPLLVLPGVLNPKLMRTGEFFASQLSPVVIPGDAEVLDMGTGSGVCAIAAARHARRVVAVDIDQTAVRCARLNVLLNQVDGKVEVLSGDLFAPVSGRRFDVILFNPPFIRGAPRHNADRAWRSVDVPERFAAGLEDHLHPGGHALVLLSTYGDAAAFIGEFRRHHFNVAVAAERGFVNEKLAILRLTRA